MSPNFKFQISNFKLTRGYTLIELMVVLSITAVLGVLGIVGFVGFNKNQVLQSSASEVATMLNLAKSRAQSQIKPSSCSTGNYLSGYVVVIGFPRTYTLKLRCLVGGVASDIVINEENKTLPQNVNFDNSTSPTSYFFPIQKGGVETSGQIVIISEGKTKIITVNSVGGVSIQ